MFELLQNTWTVYLDTAFWLLLGLFAAGLIKSYLAEDTLTRWVGGSGFSAVSRAALFGAPLPLCSCGVLPAAIGLHRAGASKEATVSFLISTPETSVDSIAVTYALMGPVMAVYRPVAALLSAIVTGLMTALIGKDDDAKAADKDTAASCCASGPVSAGESCCGDGNTESEPGCCGQQVVGNRQSRFFSAIRYAAVDLLDDIAAWMVVGIVVAGIILTYIPADWLAHWGQGVFAMLIMLVVGIPMYICAVASTPVAAGLIVAGVSPGAVLVFLLVGPATNIAGLALVSKELGIKVTVVYLGGLAVMSLGMGLLLEALLRTTGLVIDVRLGETHMMLPDYLGWGSAILLLILAIKPLRRRLLPWLERPGYDTKAG
jgi:uncharacterized membrane protein YraQ (UPF0718 family)